MAPQAESPNKKFEASGFIFEAVEDVETGDVEFKVSFAYNFKMRLDREMRVYTDLIEHAQKEMANALVDYAIKDLTAQGRIKDVEPTNRS